MDGFGRTIPVDAAVLFFEHGGKCGPFKVLGRWFYLSAGEAVKGFCDEIRTHACQAVVKLPGCLFKAYGSFGREKHVAGVQIPVHDHGCDSGFPVLV